MDTSPETGIARSIDDWFLWTPGSCTCFKENMDLGLYDVNPNQPLVPRPSELIWVLVTPEMIQSGATFHWALNDQPHIYSITESCLFFPSVIQCPL